MTMAAITYLRRNPYGWPNILRPFIIARSYHPSILMAIFYTVLFGVTRDTRKRDGGAFWSYLRYLHGKDN